MAAEPRGSEIHIEGLRELRARLRAVDVGLTVEIRKLNFDGALIVAKRSNAHVPVGDPSTGDPHPGKLAASIRARATARAASVTAGSSGVPYAAPIHWGWPKHNIAPNKFIYRALDESTPEVILHYEGGIKRLVEETRA